MKPDKTFEERRKAESFDIEPYCADDGSDYWSDAHIEGAFKAGADWARSELEAEIEAWKVKNESLQWDKVEKQISQLKLMADSYRAKLANLVDTCERQGAIDWPALNEAREALEGK